MLSKFLSRFSLLIAGTVFLISCTKEPKTLEEYKTWFADPENGLIKTKTINNLLFTVQYRPVDLMLVNEVSGAGKIDKTKLDSLRKTYGLSQYFLLEIQPAGRSENSGDLIKSIAFNYDEYAEKVKAFAFNMKDNVRLIVNSDTIEPVLYNYEQGFDLSSTQKFLFAFQPSVNQSLENMVFFYDDNFFGAGRVKFNFLIKQNKIPSLSHIIKS